MSRVEKKEVQSNLLKSEGHVINYNYNYSFKTWDSKLTADYKSGQLGVTVINLTQIHVFYFFIQQTKCYKKINLFKLKTDKHIIHIILKF